MSIHKIMIADDDSLSREILINFLSFVPHVSVCGEAVDGQDLIEKVMIHKPDLILLDINMPNLNGINAIKTLQTFDPEVKFIFITGHDDFAVEAFGLSAVDYIVKPVELSRLFQAIEKAIKILNIQQMNGTNRKLVIKHRGSIHYIPFDDIYFIEKMDRKSLIHTMTATYTTGETLEGILQKLDDRFIQTHRSFVINIEHLAHITPVDETYTASFNNYDKKAIISKHKIAKTQQLIKEYLK